jgi:TolB protein
MIANPNVRMSLSRSGLILVVFGVVWLTLVPAWAQPEVPERSGTTGAGAQHLASKELPGAKTKPSPGIEVSPESDAQRSIPTIVKELSVAVDGVVAGSVQLRQARVEREDDSMRLVLQMNVIRADGAASPLNAESVRSFLANWANTVKARGVNMMVEEAKLSPADQGNGVDCEVLLTLPSSRAPGAKTKDGAVPGPTVVGELLFSGAPGAKSAAEPTLEDDLAEVGRPLWLIDADGSNLRRLTRMPDYTCCGTPQWCADGTKIACDAWKGHKGENFRDAHVLVISADGSSFEDLGDGAMPSWSPGGNRIAYCRYGSGVWIMCADGSAKTQLDRSGWCARWSPDGREIAWVVYDEGCNLCVHDLIEGDRRLVLEGEHRRYAAINHSFTWSPDGKRLCFKGYLDNGKDEIVIVDAAGSSKGFNVRYTQKTGWNLSWRPDGRRIMLGLRNPETKSMQLYTMNPDTDNQPELFPGQPANRINAESAWSPDGKRIVFPSERRN